MERNYATLVDAQILTFLAQKRLHVLAHFDNAVIMKVKRHGATSPFDARVPRIRFLGDFLKHHALDAPSAFSGGLEQKGIKGTLDLLHGVNVRVSVNDRDGPKRGTYKETNIRNMNSYSINTWLQAHEILQLVKIGVPFLSYTMK